MTANGLSRSKLVNDYPAARQKMLHGILAAAKGNVAWSPKPVENHIADNENIIRHNHALPAICIALTLSFSNSSAALQT